MPQIIKMLAVLFAAGFGVYSIWQPKIKAQAAGFDLPGNKGVAELRTSFGGLFVGLGRRHNLKHHIPIRHLHGL